jgi:LysR family transcriptional regulator, cys regulon transcriptional activator
MKSDKMMHFLHDKAMKLDQLRSVREIARQKWNITRAAEHLNASQPGVTRHLQTVERTLGVKLFVRDKKRLVGLTAAGRLLLPIVERALNAVEDLRRAAEDFNSGAAGDLTVATVHTHARYALPPALERFVHDYPAVRLRLRQGNRVQVCDWVSAGEADLAVAIPPTQSFPQLAFFPCFELHRIVLTTHRHALLRKRHITLKDIAEYPIITYDSEFAARGEIMEAFEESRLPVNVVLSATDADIMKTYVRAGLGVGIVAHTAYHPDQDKGLRAVDARHLFKSNAVHISVRRGGYLSIHALNLIRMFAPQVWDALRHTHRVPATV